MCGLSGEINFDGKPADAGALQRMTDTLAPRGPDGSGIILRGPVGFGHRRLSVIDLSEKSQQPMADPELGLTGVFNGCIYNYPELRAELEGEGYRFFSTGDTEVVLKAWRAWGDRCVERFHGMFAFVIHERDSGRTVMARDRFGIKPLYVAESGRRLRFASTLPALLAAGDVDRSIDPVGLHHYMSFHAVVPPPHTILNGVKKFPPATIRVIEPDGSRRDRVYWTPEFTRGAEDEARPFEEWRDRVLDSLRVAVKRRMVADVPVGVLLSGGVDSSLVVGLLAELGQTDLMTFSVGFEAANGEKGDEFVWSDLIARHYGTDHHQIFVPHDRLMDALPGTIGAMSEPMVSYDNVGFYLLSQEVSKHIRVVQSGQGADEVFAGYHWYPPMTDASDPVETYAQAFFDRSHETLSQQLNPRWLADTDVSRALVEAHFARPGATTPVDKALRLDSQVMLVDDPVKRVDNMTMAFGLEARVPFLDHELVELAARIPPQHKLSHGGKGVLKEAARKVIPAEVIDRKKGYFPVPALKHIQGPYLEMARDALTSQAARERGLFQTGYLDALFDDPTGHMTPLHGSELWQAPSDAAAFNLPGGGFNSGLLRYAVVYKPGSFGYYLAAEANQSALALATYPQAMRTLWYKSADSWTRRLASERDMADDGGAGENSGGFWFQPYGEGDRVERVVTPLSGPQTRVDLSQSQDYFGAQGGADIVRATSIGQLKLGITGGYLSSHQDIRETADRVEAEVWNLGAYAGWSSGGSFAHVLVKYDDYGGEIQNLPASLRASLDGHSQGAMVELGHRFSRGAYVLEPFASVGWVETELKGFTVGTVGAAFDPDRSVRGRFGARFGAYLASGGFLYTGASYVREFEGDDTASIGSGASALVVAGHGKPDYGEASFGVSLGESGPVTGFFEANARFGSTEGGGLRAGVKVAF